jgi:hypothetical protein
MDPEAEQFTRRADPKLGVSVDHGHDGSGIHGELEAIKQSEVTSRQAVESEGELAFAGNFHGAQIEAGAHVETRFRISGHRELERSTYSELESTPRAMDGEQKLYPVIPRAEQGAQALSVIGIRSIGHTECPCRPSARPRSRLDESRQGQGEEEQTKNVKPFHANPFVMIEMPRTC